MNTILLKSISSVRPILALMAVTSTGGGQAAMAGEVPMIEASYVWQSSVDNGDGTYAVTFDVTLTNPGIDDLLDLKIGLLDATLPVRVHEDNLLVGNLGFDATAQLSWTITSYAEWPATLGGEYTIVTSGEATDAFGDNIGVAVISGGQCNEYLARSFHRPGPNLGISGDDSSCHGTDHRTGQRR